MKRIIRFFASISGVEDDIAREVRKSIGHEICWEAHCFSKENKNYQVVNELGIELVKGNKVNGLHIRKKIFGF